MMMMRLKMIVLVWMFPNRDVIVTNETVIRDLHTEVVPKMRMEKTAGEVVVRNDEVAARVVLVDLQVAVTPIEEEEEDPVAGEIY